MTINRANLIRALVMLAIAGFYVYRYSQSDSMLYLLLLAGFALSALLALIGLLSARWQNVLVNLGVSLFFLDFVFAEIDWAKFGQVLLQANYWWLIPSMAFVMVHIYFRTLRSQWLMKPLGEVPFWPAFRALVIGITGNVVLPARAGEFIRAYVIGRSTGVSKTGAFATLVVERIFDGLTVLLVLVGVVIFGVQNQELQQAGILGAFFYIGALVALFIFMAKRHWADAVIHRVLPDRVANFAIDILDGFTGGLAVLKNPQQLGMVLLWNILTWVAIPISFYFALLTFDFGAPVTWETAILMLPAMALALTIPGAPAGFGLVQFAVKLTMDTTFAGVAVAPDFAEKVAATTLIIHFSQFAPEVLAGVISFMYEGLTTGDIATGQELTATEAEANT
jgi:uncharacterized protein (TIRG00374 family)